MSSHKPSLVFLHVGNSIPPYLLHTLYQTLLIHQTSFIDVYILVNKINIPTLQKHISNFSLYDKEILTTIYFIPLENLKQNYDVYEKYNELMNEYETKNPELFKFRNKFWKVSTERFYYIYSFMIKYNLSNIFHLENDIMLYTPVSDIFENIKSSSDKMWVVQDSKHRAIGSIVFIPTTSVLYQFLQFSNSLLSKSYVNDMTLLGLYPLKHKFPDTPTPHIGIFDGAAIGQYLGGTDLRNSNNANIELNKFINPTIGFVNETSDFKPNKCNYTYIYKDVLPYYPRQLKKYFCVDKQNNHYQIHNLHIHSKQPYTFSSVFDISYTDLLTFPNILNQCDAIICTEGIYKQNTNAIINIDKVLLVKNPKSINVTKLKSCFNDFKKTNITCFVWDNLLEKFIKDIFGNLQFTFTIVTNATEEQLNNLNLSNNIQTIYTLSPITNITKTIKFIPCISSIIKEDEHISFYSHIVNTYMYSKSTVVHFDDQSSLIDITKAFFLVCKNLNSVWIALYLGVIPLFILEENVTQDPVLETYTQLLDQLNLPYVATTADLVVPSFINKHTYNSILNNVFNGKSIFCNNILKLKTYL